MTIKVINGNFTVGVVRNNEHLRVSPGQPFDFTADEIKAIEAAHGDDALRDPVNESPAKVKGDSGKGGSTQTADGL